MNGKTDPPHFSNVLQQPREVVGGKVAGQNWKQLPLHIATHPPIQMKVKDIVLRFSVSDRE